MHDDLIIIITTLFAILFLSANQYIGFYDEFISINDDLSVNVIHLLYEQQENQESCSIFVSLSPACQHCETVH